MSELLTGADLDGLPATVVLVHGAWHGAWCWERVVEALAEGGIRAVAVDLPGHGADPGLLIDLHGDAARVRTVLDAGRPDVGAGFLPAWLGARGDGRRPPGNFPRHRLDSAGAPISSSAGCADA